MRTQTKAEVKNVGRKIQTRLDALSLTLSEKKTKIFPLSQGINFLGFKYWLTDTGKLIKELSRENISHERRKLRKQKALADRGIMTRKQCNECYASWKAHAQRGNTHNLIIQMDKFYKELWRGNNVQIKDGKTAIARRTAEERGT